MGRGSIFEDQEVIKTPFTISNDILFVINDVVNVKKHFKTTHQNNLKVEISFISMDLKGFFQTFITTPIRYIKNLQKGSLFSACVKLVTNAKKKIERHS